MSRRAKPLSAREVEQIVQELRARPLDLDRVGEKFHLSRLTLRRIGRANGIHFWEQAQ